MQDLISKMLIAENQNAVEKYGNQLKFYYGEIPAFPKKFHRVRFNRGFGDMYNKLYK